MPPEEETMGTGLPKDLAFGNELKRHPLLLDYTLNKMSSSKKLIEEEGKPKFQSTLLKIRRPSLEAQ